MSIKSYADDQGIHFPDDIDVYWGEMQSVHAEKSVHSDGKICLAVSVFHMCGVDFGIHSSNVGFDQVIEMMAKQLIGFSPAKLKAVGSWDEDQPFPNVWQRDLSVQPFNVVPRPVDNREPTDEERDLMARAHQASIAMYEKLLNRKLTDIELACVHTDFVNGRLDGHISSPLCNLLMEADKRRTGGAGR